LCDSDEEVPEALAVEIRRVIETPSPAAAYRVRRKSQFLGEWMLHGPWTDDRVVRLFRKDKGRLTRKSVHEGIVVDGEVRELANELHHYTHPTLSESIRRLNRYTTLEAHDRVGRRKIRLVDPLLPPAGIFFKYYVIKGCWRAGMRGFLLSAITAMYKSVLYIKIYQLQRALAPDEHSHRAGPPAIAFDIVAVASISLRPSGGLRMFRVVRGGLCATLFVGASLAVYLSIGQSAFGQQTVGNDGPTLTVGLLSEPSTLNPLAVTSVQARDILEQIYLKLLEEQPDFLNFRPRLAKAWEFSEDSLTITFYLRDDVRWTDGVPVTAEDVRFTWELEVDTVVAWRSAGIKSAIRDVEVIDPHTAAFHFSRRYPYQLMDANDGVILPKHILETIPREELRTHPLGRSPVGNGPFMLDRWEPGQYIELVRSPDYYENGKPFIDRVIFKFVPDMVTLATQLKKGEIDVLESIPSDILPGLRETYPHIKIYTYPSRQYVWIAWNLKNELFDSPEVRRALTMAIDRGEIIETLFAGRAAECKSPIHANLWAYDESIEAIPFDPDEARRTLERLGWRDGDGDGILDRNGKPFAFDMITNHGNQQRVDIATMAEAYLKKIGVRARVRTLEYGTVTEKLLGGDYDSCVFGWGTATKPDITNQWHSSSVRPKGMNISSYQNPVVDDLIDRAKVTLDGAEAKRLWSQAQRIIYYDQPFTFIAIPYEINAADRRFCRVEPNAISFFYNLRDWRVGAACE
jgi:peptide/nickel transport system substrate-binding protein